ncbi:hypothetical protein F5Y16DRAFT_396436 [Xylariaceae sp. FL0255]|nr:hypothetical protein F5Y16DRAFT_396436 [Xylariaceae sp. FL0255]
MALPTLCTLNIFGFDNYGHHGLSNVFFTSLRNLSVLLSKMKGSELELLLTCCMGLQSFLYDANAATQGHFPSLKSVRYYVQEQIDDQDMILKFGYDGISFTMIVGIPSDALPRRRDSMATDSSVDSMADSLD